jgi:hypothetical protein
MTRHPGRNGSTRKQRHAHRPSVYAAILLAAILLTPTTSDARNPGAKAAHSTALSDNATLHLIHAIGNTLIEQGNAKGTLKGRVKIRLHLNASGASATAHFIMYLPGGHLLGHANGRATTGKNGWESFSGTMRIDPGTGRYAHASGSGKMYGALNRHTDTLIVQVRARARGL